MYDQKIRPFSSAHTSKNLSHRYRDPKKNIERLLVFIFPYSEGRAVNQIVIKRVKGLLVEQALEKGWEELDVTTRFPV